MDAEIKRTIEKIVNSFSEDSKLAQENRQYLIGILNSKEYAGYPYITVREDGINNKAVGFFQRTGFLDALGKYIKTNIDKIRRGKYTLPQITTELIQAEQKKRAANLKKLNKKTNSIGPRGKIAYRKGYGNISKTDEKH